MKPHLAVLVLAALPLAAGAQIMPAPPRLPMVVGPSPDRVAGISVSGRAVVQVPVRDAAVVAYARGDFDTNAALAALRAAGVDDPKIGPPDGMISAHSPAVLRGIVRNVTMKKLEDLQRAGVQFAAAHPGVAVDNVRFTARPSADACARAEEQARGQAFADARRRAQAIASLAGAVAGPVLAASESGGCPALAGDGPEMSLDVSTMTTPITVFENLTFALTTADAAKRRPL